MPLLGNEAGVQDIEPGDFLYWSDTWRRVVSCTRKYYARDIKGKWILNLAGVSRDLILETPVFLVKNGIDKEKHIRHIFSERILTRFLEEYLTDDFFYKPPDGLMFQQSLRHFTKLNQNYKMKSENLAI